MFGSRHVRLRVGVVGLGRLWEARHKPALMRLRERFRVTAVYDQVHRRAEIESQQLGCAAVAGLTELIGRADVDVVYLMTPQWFGLHPIELACEAGKPVYCALPLASSLAELEQLTDQVESSGILFMPEFARRFYPATLRLRELIATSLGTPRLVVGHGRLFGYDRYGHPGPTTQLTPAPLLIDPGSFLLDWCCFLFQAEPLALQGWKGAVLPQHCDATTGEPDFESFVAEFEGGGIAQISFGRYHRTAWGDATRFLPPPGFQIYGEKGAAWVELPDRIQWSDPDGTHEERLPLEPTVGDLLNDQFHRLVRGDQSMAPSIRDALNVTLWSPRSGRASRKGERSCIASRPDTKPGGAAMTAEAGESRNDEPPKHAASGSLGRRLVGPLLVACAASVGIGLPTHSAWRTRPPTDEVAYLRIAARWYRTGDQAEITRMGSPLTFWKLQQGPVLWVLDRLGFDDLIDDPIRNQARLLPIARVGSLWIWGTMFALVVAWSRWLYGPVAMVVSAWLLALSPNVLAHGGLLTMEPPLMAASAAVFLLFWRFLVTGRSAPFWGAAIVCGLAFSCKFTAIVFPPLLGLAWWITESPTVGLGTSLLRVIRGMILFLAVMALANLVVTGFALLPLTTRPGLDHPSLDSRLGSWLTTLVELPWPQDAVGFITQMRHQRSGGSSYLLGERRTHGWWYYYFVALAVKAPLSLGLLVLARLAVARHEERRRGDRMLPVAIVGFLALTALGSSRNYGIRYLLPLSPLAVVWLSGITAREGWGRRIAAVCLIGQAIAVASSHPYEITYFNRLAGGSLGGRHILADSNLDWGQGLVALADLQQRRPELRDLTLYAFGDTRPEYYGVAGICRVIDAGSVHPDLPERLSAATEFVGVSASLQWGPWGPPDYFRALNGLKPYAMTDDTTIAIYRTRDLIAAGEATVQ
ncbi:MAG: Gfo/Idh/MocA family oxidoreductase [Isosphaeraceae bacterium]